jgi:hypothetical protein
MSSHETEAYAVKYGLVVDNNGFLSAKKRYEVSRALCATIDMCAEF